ncbi:hypothetical protein HJC23_007333 [Cyclotella cryptica]|uniref:NECAP PHear domain-containing protein n=1 Tax=Cyclotella cryptica TaxID=29204 RepID=A0ABD3PDG3_9STRA|eukprot:CCRYP_015733-RA/>CCRYP_015733-RA protein AED:0.32 eAED:0.32 QI:0/-1/0/1/-1/1/1/0/231
MKSAEGHRAELWDLSKPLSTCSLLVVRRDDSLCIDIMAERPKPNAPAGAKESYLFAQSNAKVDLSKPGNQLEHWVVPVVDSSRYFALRIRDPNSGREAFIGIGFRERLDATNFRMSMEDYVNSIRRECKAEELRKKYEESTEENSLKDSEEKTETDQMNSQSHFTLKEGEKIHINIKSSKPRTKRQPMSSSGTGLTGLRLPPPPASAARSTSDPAPSDAAPSDDEWGDFEG